MRALRHLNKRTFPKKLSVPVTQKRLNELFTLQVVYYRHSTDSIQHKLNMELDLRSLFGLLCRVQLYSLAETSQLLPSSRIWAHIRECYWSAKIDDSIFVTPWYSGLGSGPRTSVYFIAIRYRTVPYATTLSDTNLDATGAFNNKFNVPKEALYPPTSDVSNITDPIFYKGFDIVLWKSDPDWIY